MKEYIPEITPEVAFKKFYLRELFKFFIDKRKEVFGDEPFTFSVEDFASFLERKKIKSVMSTTLNPNFIKAHLTAAAGLKKRNKKLRIIYPEEPILQFVAKRNGTFKVDCNTQYLKPAIEWFTESVKDGSFYEKKKESLFKETREHKINFLGKDTENSLGIKERGIFGTLASNFNKPCPYGDIFDSILRQYNFAREKQSKLMRDYNSVVKQKGFIDDGIQAMRKKLYEISGKPDTIKTIGGHGSKYILTY